MLADLKAKTPCKDCGRKGHWRGDKECTMRRNQPYERRANVAIKFCDAYSSSRCTSGEDSSRFFEACDSLKDADRCGYMIVQENKAESQGSTQSRIAELFKESAEDKAIHYACQGRICRHCGSDSRTDAGKWWSYGQCPGEDPEFSLNDVCLNECGNISCSCKIPTEDLNRLKQQQFLRSIANGEEDAEDEFRPILDKMFEEEVEDTVDEAHHVWYDCPPMPIGAQHSPIEAVTLIPVFLWR